MDMFMLQCMVLFCVITAAFGQVYPLTRELDGTRNITAAQINEMAEMQGMFKQVMDAFTQGMTNIGSFDVSYACLNDTKTVIEGILHGDKTAIMFLDADVKPRSGILNGNVFWIGDYTECISISIKNPYTNTNLKGNYFSVGIRTSIVPILVVGVCLPDSCEDTDTKTLINLALSVGRANATSPVEAVFDSDKPSIGSEQIGTICVAAFVIIIVAIGTIIDLNEVYFVNKYEVMSGGEVNNSTEDVKGHAKPTNQLNGPIEIGSSMTTTKHGILRALKAFSVYSNTKKLVNTSTAKGPLACLNGLRVISICWVIQGHTYEFTQPFLSNTKYVQNTLTHSYSFQAILNGTFSVDTFFFMSGLLVAYLALKELKSKGRLNWFYFFGHRFWRLTPMYAFLLFVFTTLSQHLVHGPFRWFLTEKQGPLFNYVDQCKHTWWSNLLYINNLYPNYGSLKGCMSWTWYLANDMQFYVFIAPLVIVLLNKNKIIGLLYSGLLIVACLCVRGAIAAHFGMNQFSIPSKHMDSPWVKNGPIYQYPFTRFSVYVVGLVTGFILHQTNCKIKMNKLVTSFGWFLSASAGYMVVYGLYYYYKNGTNMLTSGSYLYIATDRTAWSLCLAWLVIACASGRGGWVNTILSLKVWAPLGRLTYAAYLVHPIVIVVFWGNQFDTIKFSELMLIYLFISNVVITYGASYIISMVIEAPMMQLEKIILSK